MSADQRLELARLEQALVEAAVCGGPTPAGLDPANVRVMAAVLARKRMRTVAKCWPCLANELGPGFTATFERFAESHRLPADGGGLADGRAFAQFIARRQRLTSITRNEIRRFDLHYRIRAGRLKPRWFAAAILRLHQQIVLSIYCRHLGTAQLALPLPRLAARQGGCRAPRDVS